MQKFLNTELGRSLVEMLGVLAIVGVLSIGAIAGYSYAITKWKAGEILSDLHMRAVEYTRQMAMTRVTPDFMFDNFEFGDENSLGNPVAGFPLFDDSDYFEIDVRGVSAEVCEQIIRDYDLPIINVAVNDGDWGAVEEECRVEMPNDMVTMTFLFYKTLENMEKEFSLGTGKGVIITTPHLTTPHLTTTSHYELTCSEDEKKVWYSGGNGISQYVCCPSSASGYYAWAEEKCCASGEWAFNGHCCASASSGWGLNVERCCTTEEKRSYAYDAEGKEQYYCCPRASEGWGVNVNRCCDADQGEKQYYNYDSNNRYNYFCCPANGGTGGWGWNVNRCCTTEETLSGSYYCCPTGQIWDSTTERCVGEEKACATNDDCLANEFCAYPNATSCTVKPTTGVCQPATVSHTKTINDKTYKRSSDPMNFWSAKNFCARIGGSMVSVSDFRCGYDFVTNKKWGYCNADDTDTSYGTLPDSRSDTMKKFLSGLGSGDVWTDNDYSACYAYAVHLGSGLVDYGSRDLNNGYVYALCRVGGA